MKQSTSNFTPLYRRIGGMIISGSKMGHIQTTIILLIFVEKILNLCSNSSLGCLLSKIYRPRLQIPNCSNTIVKTVNKGPFATHFLSNYLMNNQLLTHIFMDKVQLQNWLQHQAINSLNKINITAYFENLTVELYVLYALNTHVNFCVNWLLFTI